MDHFSCCLLTKLFPEQINEAFMVNTQVAGHELVLQDVPLDQLNMAANKRNSAHLNLGQQSSPMDISLVANGSIRHTNLQWNAKLISLFNSFTS